MKITRGMSVFLILATMFSIGCRKILLHKYLEFQSHSFEVKVNNLEASIPVIDSVDLPTSRITMNPSDIFQCMNMEEVGTIFELPISDTLVFEGSFQNRFGFFSLESGQNKVKSFLDEFNPLSVYNEQMSPNQDRVSFINEQKTNDSDYLRDLVVADAAQNYQIFPKLLENKNVGGWLNDEIIILHPFDTDPLGKVVLFNPFNGHQEEFLSPFDQIYTGQIIDWNSARIVYHSSLNYAAYLHDDPDSVFYKIEMYDIREDKPIWSIGRKQVAIREPDWIPEAKLVVVVPTESNDGLLEVILVDLSGVAETLYQFEGSTETLLSVSPTGAYLTFFASSGENTKKKWILFDMKSKKAMDLCIFDENLSIAGPIWSPDGDQFITILWESSTGFGQEPSHILFFDTNLGQFFAGDLEIYPIAWLKSNITDN